jgi:signal transduction histidine kinase
MSRARSPNVLWDFAPLDPSGRGADAWEEMKRWVRFSDVDAGRLRALVPLVSPHLDHLTDNFYAEVLSSPEARKVLANEAQVERLKYTLQRWVIDMLTGPHDAIYAARRRTIGEVHVRVGLPERYVFTAMNVLRRDLCDIVRHASPPDQAWETCHSLMRITDLELSLMSAAYLQAHEEQKLRSLQHLIVENMPVTVLCLDGQGIVTAATRPSTRLFGGSAPTGQHYELFLPPDLVEAADLPTHVGEALAQGTEVRIARATLTEGSEHRHFRITLVPLHHELARLLLHIEELTDVVAAEARLQQAESLARVGTLAANIAHEIRNPLAGISAALQVITTSFPQEDRRRPIIGKIQEQVLRMDRLVNDLLHYSRPATPRLGPVRLDEAAREAVVQAHVEATLDTAEAPYALADGHHVIQILVNLLQNARDAAAGAPIAVRVGPGAAVEVRDGGPGVPPALRDSLFEPFVTTKTRGTGLGLAISRKLARAMGGELLLIECEAGAAFRLSLPVAPASGRASPAGREGCSG